MIEGSTRAQSAPRRASGEVRVRNEALGFRQNAHGRYNSEIFYFGPDSAPDVGVRPPRHTTIIPTRKAFDNREVVNGNCEWGRACRRKIDKA